VELVYDETPGVSPPVVLLHGSTTSRAGWRSRAPFWDGHRSFAYDARGHGESGRTPGQYRLHDFCRDAVRILERVVMEPAVLVGHSLGGMTAIYVAAERPDLVRGILLADPGLYLHELGLRNMEAPFELWREQTGRPIDELEASGLGPLRARDLNRLDPAVWDVWMDLPRNFEGWDTDGLLKKIRCPVLLQYGEQELGSIIYDGEAERAANLIKRGGILQIKGSGHSAMIAQPEEFLALASEFIREVALETTAGHSSKPRLTETS
jgi:pimeloyl-ACP methyl ester carboxylesterase